MTKRSAGAAALAVAAGSALVLYRARPDVAHKPIWIDEAIAGLIAMRPLPEVVETVLWDRGGAPLHFVLTHVAFWVDASPEAMRWVSVAFAVATVWVTYDLGRRLAGTVGGSVAALVAASSSLLWVYASVGRMYALFAFAGALAADLFVRALELRTGRAALAAAAGAWLLPAVHPYGGIVVAVEALVALVVWRGRPLRPALPVAAVGFATLPFLIADIRLAGRFGVGASEERGIASPGEVFDLFARTVGGFAGYEGLALAFFSGLALAGAIVLLRREPAFLAFALLALAAPLFLLILGRSGESVRVATRHLIFALPLWSALIGVGAARAVRALIVPVQVAFVVALTALAAVAASDLGDPRSLAEGRRARLAGPAGFVERDVVPGDVLFPYSPVFLAALPATEDAIALPRERATLLPALEHIDFPVASVFVAVPRAGARVAATPGTEQFRAWVVARVEGPFQSREAVLGAAAEALAAADEALAGGSARLRGYLLSSRAAVCTSLRDVGGSCPAG